MDHDLTDGGSDVTHSYATLPPRLRPQRLRTQRERDKTLTSTARDACEYVHINKYTHAHILPLFKDLFMVYIYGAIHVSRGKSTTFSNYRTKTNAVRHHVHTEFFHSSLFLSSRTSVFHKSAKSLLGDKSGASFLLFFIFFKPTLQSYPAVPLIHFTVTS